MSFVAAGSITVIVCTRDRPERLVGCLAAVNKALRPGDELLVVDSASTSSATREVAEAAGARVVRCDLPGLSRARNLGWRLATHDVVAFTDDDCRPQPSWLHELTLALKRPEIGWTTGSVSVHEEDRGKDRPVAIVPPYAAGPISRSTIEPVGSGNNFAVRVAVLREVGPFHERLGAGTWLSGAEDIEMFDRLLTSGVTGEHAPEAIVLHQQWRSARELLRLDWGYGKGQGARLALLRKGDRAWGGRRSRELLWNDGVLSAARDLRNGYEFGAVSTTIRTLGTLLGLARGMLLRASS
jgi:glycosyltransferase involved in cell wall biosynthesis